MAVKASDQITMTDLTDVKSVCRYYLLQASTLAAPSKPTTNQPPSSWTTTEPSYTAGSTNSLYFVDLTVFSNDTFSYSDVSLSSSYEAAKTAYNKAVEAAKTATNFISYDSTDGLQVGSKQSGSWRGYRSQIKDGCFNVLTQTGTLVAQFAADLIRLGRNSADAVINLCSGKGSIKTTDFGIGLYGGNVSIKSTNSIMEIVETETEGGLIRPGSIGSTNNARVDMTAENSGITSEVIANVMGDFVLNGKVPAYLRLRVMRNDDEKAQVYLDYDEGVSITTTYNDESVDNSVTLTANRNTTTTDETTGEETTTTTSSEIKVTPTGINLQSDAVTVNGGALFVTRTSAVDNLSISANSSKSVSIDIEIEGYVPFCTRGYNMYKASSSGARASSVTCYGWWFNPNDGAGYTADVSLRNTNSSAAKIRFDMIVVYVRKELYTNYTMDGENLVKALESVITT